MHGGAFRIKRFVDATRRTKAGFKWRYFSINSGLQSATIQSALIQANITLTDMPNK